MQRNRNPLRFIARTLASIAALCFLIACQGPEPSPAPAEDPPAQTSAAEPDPAPQTASAPQNSDDISFTSYDFELISAMIPGDWKSQEPENPMRLAQFQLPKADGSGEDGPLAIVFYFGPGQGGTVDGNIQRWVGQVSQPDGSSSQDKAVIGRIEADGLEIATLDVSGAIAPTMGAAPLAGQRMLAIIAAAEAGLIFIKAVGGEADIAAQKGAFDSLAESIQAK